MKSDRNDEVVSRARERHIQQPSSLGLLLQGLGLGPRVPSIRQEPADLEPAPSGGVVDDAVAGRKLVGKEIRDDDDGVLETFGLVDGDNLDARANRLAHRRIAFGLTAGLFVLQKPDEGTQRGGRGRFVRARGLEHLPQVGHHLRAGRLH